MLNKDGTVACRRGMRNASMYKLPFPSDVVCACRVQVPADSVQARLMGIDLVSSVENHIYSVTSQNAHASEYDSCLALRSNSPLLSRLHNKAYEES